MDTQETKIYIAGLIAAGVLGIVLIYFIITIIRQQRKTQLLNREKIQAEIHTLEKERTRIAADLHDDLGPLLSAVKFKINAVEPGNEEDKIRIESASNHIDETLSRIRDISFDLMPSALSRKGLVHTLDEFIPRIEKLVAIKINFRHAELPVLSQDMTVNLYRMILEMINNAVKHSKAKELTMELKMSANKLLLIAQDNGIGFDYEKIKDTNSGLGLRNLQSRSEIMHGELSINTQPGKGVHYLLELPLS